jgi:hypothetical protein
MNFPKTIKGVEIPQGNWTEVSALKAKEAKEQGFPLLVMLDESQHAAWSMRPDYDMYCWAYQHENFVQDENASYYFLTTEVAGAWKRGEKNSRLHFYVMDGYNGDDSHEALVAAGIIA